MILAKWLASQAAGWLLGFARALVADSRRDRALTDLGRKDAANRAKTKRKTLRKDAENERMHLRADDPGDLSGDL